jgi:hypothetical protein
VRYCVSLSIDLIVLTRSEKFRLWLAATLKKAAYTGPTISMIASSGIKETEKNLMVSLRLLLRESRHLPSEQALGSRGMDLKD